MPVSNKKDNLNKINYAPLERKGVEHENIAVSGITEPELLMEEKNHFLHGYNCCRENTMCLTSMFWVGSLNKISH